MENWYFDMATKYFNLKIYKIDDVRLFVQADRITKPQFKEITGEDYDPLSIVPAQLYKNQL